MRIIKVLPAKNGPSINAPMENTAAMSPSGNGRNYFLDLVAIILIFGFLYLGLSFMRPLASPDEGRYSEIPREMVASGDWVTPHLNGMQYFYKPPMFYWMQAVSIEAFGINRVSLRLANAAMAVFGICATYAAARALYGRRVGIFSAAILGTSVLYYALGQIITLDMTVAVFIAAAMFSFIVALKRSGIWRGLLILSFFAMCALAVMSKGLIGILIPCAVIFIYAFAVGIFNFFRQLRPSDLWWCIAGVLLFLGIALPWHILAMIANPAYDTSEGMFSKNWEGQGFFWYYIIHEHFLRYIDAETSMREQPWFFFLILAPVGLIPWIVALPQSVWSEIKGGYRNLREKNPEFIFFTVWILFVILFFSISKSKLVPYIIPIYPALAVIVGVWASKVWQNPSAFKLKPAKWILVGMGYIAVIAPIVIYFVLKHQDKIVDDCSAKIILGATSAVMFVMTTITAAFIKNDRKFMALAFVSICGLLLCFNPMASLLQRPSAEPLAYEILKQRKDGDHVFIAFTYSTFQDLPVWMDELVLHIGEPPEEQKFGYMREREKNRERFFATKEALHEFLNRKGGSAFIVVRKRDLSDLEKFDIDAVEVMSNGELLLLKK